MQRLPGGTCFAHGPYTEMECPQYPACITDPPKEEYKTAAYSVLTVEDRLRKELVNQWWTNHDEHCQNCWPHMGDCYWPLPDILSTQEVLAILGKSS
jgi:hypothetical protein